VAPGHQQSQIAKVVWNQNGVYRAHSCSDPSSRNAWLARLYKRVDHVFYQSKFCRDSARQFMGERAGPGEILYNAVDTTFFVPPAACEKRPGDGDLRLLMAGSHNDAYRLLCSVQTLSLVRSTRPARLLIAGRVSAKLETETRKLISELCLEPYVQFLGPYPQRAAPSIYRQGDVYLSTKYMDACPSAVIEAMSCGLPVVYSQSGGTTELVGEDAGMGVPASITWSHDIPPNPEELANRVLRVAEHLPRYSEAARQRAVEHFDLEPWIERHIQVFAALLERR